MTPMPPMTPAPGDLDPPPALRLLDPAGVTWEGRPVPGERTHALLAALALAFPRPVPDARLVAEVWGDAGPANPTKALQVVVSRLRSQTGPQVVARSDGGYRLGLDATEVDALRQRSALSDARAAESRGDALTVRDRAREALAFPTSVGGDDGAVAGLRRDSDELAAIARLLLGRALSVLGDHVEALALLEPALGDLADRTDPDRAGLASLAALLRSEAAVRGAPAALARFERHRERVRDSLGVDPGPELQQVHAELLAADHPVRDGVRFDATALVGRTDDVRALRALVRDSRVTSIIGPGGLGKTRLAHVLGREAEQSVVHFVELVGVTSPDDVVGEIGSALGVRDSVAGRRALTPEQRADIRARIAQQLAGAPSLLILDNCEHVVAAVADVVAYLVAVTRDLRVVTTTRSPLAISAERLFPLGQLGEQDAVELFSQRARAARPGVALDADAVRRVVRRLDGLPLAIELAAAKVRVMAVPDIARRLDDRFALLRGGDRSAPDRHRTLLAVIDWSWNLLDEPERLALRWLSLFHDGFTLEAAEEVLAGSLSSGGTAGGAVDVLDVVQSLADQSLLAVVDAPAGVRFRMLETVREFGRLRLAEHGDLAAAQEAQRRWARAYAATAQADLFSVKQFEVMDDLAAEENNLADLLRDALAGSDPTTVVVLLAALGGFWTIRGEHQRVIALSTAVDGALRDWVPPDELMDVALTAATVMATNTAVAELGLPPAAQALLDGFGDRATLPETEAIVQVLRVFDPLDPPAAEQGLRALSESPRRRVATVALQWLSHLHENDGDPDAARVSATRAVDLWREEDGPWALALQRAQLAGLHSQVGDLEGAAHHARLALPVLDRLEAGDDAIQARAVLALRAMGVGDLVEAERYVAELVEIDRTRPGFAGGMLIFGTRAELALAQGDTAGGLLLYREAAAAMRSLRFPGLAEETGLEPWVLVGLAAALATYALQAEGEEGLDLYDAVRADAGPVLDLGRSRLDFPIAGLVLYSLGAWGLTRGSMDVEDAVRLLALADAFAYTRFSPTLARERTATIAERLAPGLAEVLAQEYAGRRGPALLTQARALVARLE